MGKKNNSYTASYKLKVISFAEQFGWSTLHEYSGTGSSVGIATDYGLDGPGIDSRWGRNFSLTSRPARPGVHPASCTMGTGSFPGVRRPGRDADHLPPPSAEVEKE
jgi:hypothetical protein